MANLVIGTVELADSSKDVTIKLDGDNGNVTLGGGGHDGDLLMKNAAGATTVGVNGQTGAVHLGGSGEDGDLLLRASNNHDTIHLNGSTGNVRLGGGGRDGDLSLLNSAGSTTIRLDGQSGTIHIRDWSISVPDFVFDEDYPLFDLDRLRDFVAEHGHLPDVPSTADVAADGVNLTEFCMTLLQKIEELTRYVLDQERRISALERTVSAPAAV